jgi:DNA polymerase elongation subunit (family B)
MEKSTIEQPAVMEKATGEDIEIKNFLEGRNPLENVVAIETSYNRSFAEVVMQNPHNTTKVVKRVAYKPFVFIKDLKRLGVQLYKTPQERNAAMHRFKIRIEPLRTTDDNGAVVDRLDNGYKYRVSTTSDDGYQAIQNFFRYGGIDMRGKSKKRGKFTMQLPPRRDDLLYTKLEADLKNENATLLYNHLDDRLEIHIKSSIISKYVDKRDDDDTSTYIKIVGDKDELQYKKDFEIHEFPEYGTTVVVLLPFDRQNKLPEYVPSVEAMLKKHMDENPDDVYDTKSLRKLEKIQISVLKAHNDWSKSDAELQKEINKWRKEVDANGGVPPVKDKYPFKKISYEYSESYSDLFFTMKNDEQFMVDTGIRLFKGIERYEDVHKFIFDIETTGLYGNKGHKIFMIGMKDNREFQKVAAVNELGSDDEERRIILEFFAYVKHLNPSIIYGYNSENFDWQFIVDRCIHLGIDISKIPVSLRDGVPMKRREGASVKFGGETERYTQTLIWGSNIIDIMHAVRRTQAINSDLKEARLKYVCKFEGIAKPNRVYVEGTDIFTMWSKNKVYAVNGITNAYAQIPDHLQNKAVEIFDNNFKDGECPDTVRLGLPVVYPELAEYLTWYGEDTVLKRGGWLVEQYLIDDLWETEQVDTRYNVDRFMVGKYLPTGFVRTTTMGGAAQWNMIMTAWSYEKNLAIPAKVSKVDFVGGLSRTFMLGKFSNVYKFDFSGLYPSIQLEWGVFPKLDVTGVLRRLLGYFKTTRDVFKAMANDESLDKDTRQLAKTKQLPLKILNNSNFGANGSEFFNWADFFCAERITSTGRLYLRNMIQFFMKYGCIPTVCDTDGINMVVPEMVDVDIEGNPLPEMVNINTYRYIIKKGSKAGKVIEGADALVAKYNEEVLGGGEFMKLDNDGMWPSAINVSRKNYANMEAPDKNGKKKIKIVGNTLKDKTMPEYIKEFVDKGIKLLLEDKGSEFVDYYYSYLELIATQQIPLRKIAKKAKVKMSGEEYRNRGTDKNGRAKGRQAHMELVIQENLAVQNGDVIYYVNNGERKTHTDTTVDKKTGKLMCYPLTKDELDLDPDKLGNYNIALYVDQFNQRVMKLLVPFKPRVRETLIKTDFLKREHYSDGELVLGFYQNPNPKDDIRNFFIMEESEVRFWNRTGLDPYSILEEFTTASEYYGYDYQKKINIVESKLGIKIKTMHDRYENGDYVVSFEDKYYAYNVETEDALPIPKHYYKYLSDDAKIKYPLNGGAYEDFKKYTAYFQEKSKTKRIRHYYVNKVEKGELKMLKEI